MKKTFKTAHFERNGKHLIHIKDERDVTIASSDKSLNLPTIPEKYIQYYISEYNKGNKIETVELEISGGSSTLGIFEIEIDENNQVQPIITNRAIEKQLKFVERYSITNQPKQSIEEAADNYYWKLENNLNKSKGIDENNIKHRVIEAYKEGAKHQASISYTEDEVKNY